MIAENTTEEMAQKDVAESLLHNVDRKVKSTSGVSLFHILTGAALGTSIFLFWRGHKLGGIFVGLWAPMFQALKSASQRRK